MYPNQNYYGYNQQNPYNGGLVWVQGEAGARSFLVTPNTTVMLMDSESNVFYLKSADVSGMPLPLRVFDYSERVAGEIAPKTAQEQPAVDYGKFATVEALQALQSDFEALAARLEAINGRPARRGKEVTENE